MHRDDGHDESDRLLDDPSFPNAFQYVVDAGGARPTVEKPDEEQQRQERKARLRKRLVVGAIVIAVLAVGAYFGIPRLIEFFNTVDTDDAFIAAHLTNVGPRVSGLVTKVLVDEDDYVEPGTLLVLLDREPFEVTLAQREAAVEEAGANLAEARANVKAQLSRARANWFSRKSSQERLRRQVAELRADVATLRARQSSLHLAELDQQRIAALVRKGSATQAELDDRDNQLRVAQEDVREAWAEVQETRAGLGLPPDTEKPLDVPENLEAQQSTIQEAVSNIGNALSQVGIPFDLHHLTPDETFEQVIHMDSDEGLEAAFDRIVERAPATQVAQASLAEAKADLREARLNLSYTEIRSEIAGYIEHRSVHPGNHVQPGQTLLSARPLHVWVDANFKETQLQYIRIGLPVDLHVDAYPDRVFPGRVVGFSPATGAAGALLPPENATGNYIKVVQRLPVRIELTEPPPRDTPLFVGLSVVPVVRFKERPTGSEAGQRLRAVGDTLPPDEGAGPAAIHRSETSADEAP
ncbi:MAG TPA: HlyD family secretion protein [Pirellulales bacterium]|nr:HlyD family secretion protein [Pirellulales bacterium]